MNDPADRDDLAIRCVAHLNAILFIAGMDDLSASNVQAHVPAVADDVPGLCVRIIHANAVLSLVSRGPANAIAKLPVYALGKTGAIGSICQARAAIYVLISNKLEAIRRIWILYRKNEKLGILPSLYYLCGWAVRAVARRL